MTTHSAEYERLVEAAWEMCVEEQHYHREGWSLAKTWAFRNLRAAVDPFLTSRVGPQEAELNAALTDGRIAGGTDG